MRTEQTQYADWGKQHFLQIIYPSSQLIASPRQHGHSSQSWGMVQCQPVVKVGNGVVVGVHLLANIPLLPCRSWNPFLSVLGILRAM